MSDEDGARRRAAQPGHFCWIRVVNVHQPARRSRQRVLAVAKPPLAKAENRPPPKIKSSTSLTDRQAWTAVEELMGRDNASTVFEYGPAFQDQGDAENWIRTPEGQAWDADAENRLLISFIPDVGDHDAFDDEEDTPVPSAQETTFPLASWDPVLRHRWAGQGQEDPVFLGKAFTVPAPPANEPCPTVLHGPYTGHPRLPEAQQASSESHGAARVIAELLCLVGVDLDQPPVNLAMKQARTRLMNQVESVVYRLKAHYKRRRPVMVCAGLKPMLDRRDWRYPRHPSYPAGHGVTAGLWAELLAARYPAQGAALTRLGEAIAQRRVDTGLHFQSDVDEGLKLGRALAREVLQQMRAGTLKDHGLASFQTSYEALPPLKG